MYGAYKMSSRMLRKSVLVPTTSLVFGIIVYLILSGMFIQNFHPLSGVAEATGSGSFNYVTNTLYYETSEVSYNLEDMYNTTHLYDFSDRKHFSMKSDSLEFATGMYGQSLQWPSGQVVCEDLSIIDMSFTLETWIYPASEGPIALAGTETTYPYIWKDQNGSMLYRYSGGPSYFYSNLSVGLNTWTHIALVYDDGSGVVKWYLNGVEQGSKVIGKTRWAGKWSIGRMRPDYSSYEWLGKIDEFRIYKSKALTQSKIQEDMRTSIAHKLTLTGLIPNSDVAQLWYPDGEFARLHMLEQTADANGQVEFNVYYFSGRSTSYNGILKVVHSGRTYSSALLGLSWEDVYNFSINTNFTETLIAAFISGLIIVVPITLMVINSLLRKRRKTSSTQTPIPNV